jgi:hypothetical protein
MWHQRHQGRELVFGDVSDIESSHASSTILSVLPGLVLKYKGWHPGEMITGKFLYYSTFRNLPGRAAGLHSLSRGA